MKRMRENMKRKQNRQKGKVARPKMQTLESFSEGLNSSEQQKKCSNLKNK